jgi:Uma2 family endonuclease
VKYNVPEDFTVSSFPLPNSFSVEEYFALERASERRFEFRDGEIVCMSGGSREHATIASNLIRSLGDKIRETCRVYGSDLAVYVPDGRPYRYPDASVVCGEARFQIIDGRDCLENPALLVEILSPSSADFDRGTKFEQYKSIPDFTEYLLVIQDRPHVARRSRGGQDTWTETVFDSLDATVRLNSIGVDLTLRELYDGVSFK